MLGLSQGSYAQTSDKQKMIVLGFVEKWHKLRTNEQNNQNNEDNFQHHQLHKTLSGKDQWVLGVAFNEKH